MQDLMEKCELFLQEKLKKLDPFDIKYLDLLVTASTHNLSGLVRDLIPKVANLSFDEIRKYYGVLKPSLIMRVQGVMLYRYVPRTGAAPPDARHTLYGSMSSRVCSECRSPRTVCRECSFCTKAVCSPCASRPWSRCYSRIGRRICLYCGVENSACACIPELPSEDVEVNSRSK